MRCILLVVAALALVAPEPALAEGPAFTGQTGLLAVPTAEVADEGTASGGWAQHDPGSISAVDLQNYFASVGFLPGLEIGGRIVEDPLGLQQDYRDLSVNGKYRLDLPWGLGLAVGAQDIGGEVSLVRTTYAVATLPWRSLRFTAGYGVGPDVLDGAFGGVEWRPWSWMGLIAEHDTEDFNGGVKLMSPELVWGARLGVSGAYRGVSEDYEYGAHLTFPLGKREVGLGGAKSSGRGHGPLPQGLRAALARHGFESVRLGMRGPGTQVVGLENRVYNHSSADGIGLALGTIAAQVGPQVEQIELTLFAYGVAQTTVTVPAALYRAFLDDPAAHAGAVSAALVARPARRIEQADQVAWEPQPTRRLEGAEVVLEPVLRTFVATEYGVLDYSLGARLRLTAPLANGVMVHLGGQVPLVESNDFGPGDNFEPVGVEAGLDTALGQWAHKLSPQWTWLWSAGRTQVFRSDLDTLALEQLWLSGDATHQVRTKLMALHGGFGTRTVALAGYTWFDAARDYSLALTGGRFFAGDSGVRVDVNRYFGDTIVGLFFKAASTDDQAVGLAMSLPLTPRRDMAPGALQLKGSRRWVHGVATTINSSDQRNPLRPALLYEPQLDFDLRRDFYDSGRLGEAYLRQEVPRMYEAYELWGDGEEPPATLN